MEAAGVEPTARPPAQTSEPHSARGGGNERTSLRTTLCGPSEEFLDKLLGLLKAQPCISLLGQLEFDQVDRTGTNGLVQLDQSERPHPANAYARRQSWFRVPRK